MPFKPGQSGNPGGRKRQDPGLRRLKELTADQFKEVANAILLGKRADLAAIVGDLDTPVFKAWLAGLAQNGLTRRELPVLEFFLNRLIGKVPDKAELSGPDGRPLRLEDLIVGAGTKAKRE